METQTAQHKKKVLIVEDDAFLQSLLSQKLLSKGYVLLTSREGIKAIEIAKAEQPDIILLDILLPGMNGFDVLEELKGNEATKHINVIMLSNLGQQTDIEKALKLGASQFLVKANTTPDEVIRKIEGNK
ncbi:MAG: response regulator [bacterium]|nr:response regulator [bacterium]